MDNWISISSNSGSSGTSSVSVTAQTNTGLSRTTQVTVTASKFGRTKTATVSVAQTTSISGISMTNIVPDSTGGTYVITVSSETPYTVSASDPTWIILTPESGIAGVTTIIVVIPANTTGSGRTGGITATTTDSQYSDSISFTQEDTYTHYYGEYLTFIPKEDCEFRLSGSGVYYSTDDGNTWTFLNSNINTPTIHSGETIIWKGDLHSITTHKFVATGTFDVCGNIMSMAYSDNFRENPNLSSADTRIFTGLFEYITGLTSAENLILPSSLVPPYGYSSMFWNCTGLIKPPAVLPAMTLFEECYHYMFAGCTSLATTQSILPATTLAVDCYDYMFGGCTSIISGPILPATTLAPSCYSSMFANCTSLTNAQVLSATTIFHHCYSEMFSGCISLTTAPELPATNLSGATECYSSMFYGCTSLTTAPELPATTLAAGCYLNMFRDCTSLATVQNLPATTLANSCYSNMFYNCSALTSAPELPAPALVNGCYNYMFYGSRNLNSITCLATSGISTNNTSYWVRAVSALGTFTKASSATWPTGYNGIPSGWTVVDAT